MLKITFLGDIMCDNKMSERLSLYRNSSDGKYDFSSCFAHLSELLNESDFVLANLETPISADNSFLTSEMWSFNAPYEFAEAVKKTGVDFVSTANNHCLDRGIKGIESTVSSLDRIGFLHCGVRSTKREKYSIAKIKGHRIGVLSYTYGTNAFSNNCYLPLRYYSAVNLLQEQERSFLHNWKRFFHGHFLRYYNLIERTLYPKNGQLPIFEKEEFSIFRKLLITRDIRRIKKEKPDYIIAYLHIGGQYNTKPSLYTINTTNWFLHKGIDAVIDNHEHVIHSTKKKDNQIAAYALGNCIGSAGVYEEPFNRLSEFSIALHVYLDEQDMRLKKISFSVLKSKLTDDGKVEVWPVESLIRTDILSLDERKTIEEKALCAAELFSGRKSDKLRREQEL